MFNCPHCRHLMEDAPELAGQLVACPRCGGRIQWPGPPMEDPEPHDLSAGVLKAVALVLLLVIGLPALLICGGVGFLYYKGSQVVEKYQAETRQLETQARKFALAHLPQYGVVELSSDCDVSKFSNEVRLTGSGKDRTGRLKTIRVEWQIAEFADRKEWHLQSIEVDGERVYESSEKK